MVYIHKLVAILPCRLRKSGIDLPLLISTLHCPYYYKWKNHFVEMKGDVGMSVHEKGGKQVNATPTHKTIYNPIPTSL